MLGVLTIVMKTKTFTVLTNQRALLVSRNAEKNLETIAKTTAPATNYVEFSPKFCNLCLTNAIQNSAMIQITSN